MTEQNTPMPTTDKAERSPLYVTCRLSYDSLMTSTKSFVHNFNNLSVEEKTEFKSLNNYVKQLEKCVAVVKGHSVKPQTVRSKSTTKTSTQETVSVVETAKVAEVVETVEVAKVAEPVVEQSKPQNKRRNTKVAKDHSPTAQAIEVVQTAPVASVSTVVQETVATPVVQTVEATVVKTSGRGKKQTK
jgi:hypothetical protein